MKTLRELSLRLVVAGEVDIRMEGSEKSLTSILEHMACRPDHRAGKLECTGYVALL